MAWGYVQDTIDLKWEDYQRVDAELGAEQPAGLIVHIAGPHGNGVRIVDVWESEDAYNRFRDTTLLPAIVRALGEQQIAQGPPQREEFEVQNIRRP